MDNLSIDLYARVRDILLRCREFESNQSLRAIFVDERIHPFRVHFPEGNSIDERVRRIIEYLLTQQLSDGRAALPIFLEILADNYDTRDSLHHELKSLATEVSRYLDETNNQPTSESETTSFLTDTGSPSPPRLSISEQIIHSPKVLSWLHLADLQFRNDSDLQQMTPLFEDIQKQIDRSGTRPEFVVVTGDIAYSGQAEEYRYALRFFENLFLRLAINRDRLFFVPGNHDIRRENAASTELTEYMNFVHALRVPSPSEWTRYPYRYILRWGEHQIAICHFNTAITTDSSQGWTEQQRAYLESQIAQYAAVKGAINIALLHHTPEYLAQQGVAPAAIEALEQQADFVIHGHLHQDYASRVVRRDAGTVIIQGGSDYFVKQHPNCYNLVTLDFEKGEGTILFRRMLGDSWQADNKNQPGGQYTFHLSQRLITLWLQESESPWSPPLAGYVADTIDAQDRLGITTEVNAFSAVIASKELQPPLCLGLFGDWGSGKTFFMKRMQEHIEYLASQSQKAEKLSPPRETRYCSRIVQINFNAWHYTDADLLACLVEQIFESLGKCYSKEIEDREVEEVERYVAKLKEEKEQAQRSVETAKIETLQNILTPKYNIPDSVFTHAKSAEDVVSNLGGIAMQIRMVLKGWEFLKIFFVFLAIYVASAILQFAISRVFQGQSSAQDIDKIIDVLLKAFETVGVIYVGFKSLIKPVADVKSEVQQALAKTVDSQSVKDKEKDLNQAERVFNQEKQNLQALKSPLSQDLIDFIRSRRDSGDYKKHLGVISMIRRDFESLPDKLAGKVDRIVLYIDDLDRCPDSLVAEVLQAIHRLMAFPLFVVVVGVDSRWLLRSLEETYPMLQSNPHQRVGWSAEEIWAWQSTAQNYLEKIFQIPYNLRPMEADGFKQLVESILPPPPVATMAVQSALPDEWEASAIPLPLSDISSTISDVQEGRSDQTPPEEELAETGEPEIDLTPAILDIKKVERLFIAQLAPLIPTPRATKRFVNIYRLIRATISPTDLPAFVGDEQRPGEHRVLMVLLAILTGYPRQSPYIFRRLTSLPPNASWRATLVTFAPRQIPNAEPPQYQNQVIPMMDTGEAGQWQRLGKILTRFSEEATLPDALDSYIKWAPQAARFSFRVGKITDGDSLAADVRITHIEFNPPGRDIDGEFTRIENLGATAQRMTGWKLGDKANYTFEFPDFTLSPGGVVNVWVGQGKNSATDLYWGRKALVWNKKGDTVELRDESGTLITTYEIAP